MQALFQSNPQTSGQVDPKIKHSNKSRKSTMPVVINGCTVSFSSTATKTDEALGTVKEILLSAYRSRMARC